MFFLILGKTSVTRSTQSQIYKSPYMLPRQHHRSGHCFFYYYYHYSIDASIPCKLEIWFCLQKPFLFPFSLFLHWERKVVDFTSELFCLYLLIHLWSGTVLWLPILSKLPRPFTKYIKQNLQGIIPHLSFRAVSYFHGSALKEALASLLSYFPILQSYSLEKVAWASCHYAHITLGCIKYDKPNCLCILHFYFLPCDSMYI